MKKSRYRSFPVLLFFCVLASWRFGDDVGCFDDCGEDVRSALSICYVACAYVWAMFFVDDVMRF